MKRATLLLTLTLALCLHVRAQSGPPEEAYVLDNPVDLAFLQKELRPEPPRLIMTEEAQRLVREKLASDPVVQNVYEALRLDALEILGEPLLERELVGRRLLSVSREMLNRMNVLGAVYLFGKDPEMLKRVEEELKAVIAFQDWNPSHFLDTAEMSMAVALAVDWLGRDLSPDIVRAAKNALVEKGLKPSFDEEAMRGSPNWVVAHHNWNQVCNGGMIAAAIAVADEEPELAARVIHRALAGMPYALEAYGPDGVYPEGPTYWSYGTTFSVLTASMLESAFGTDFGLAAVPGFMESADFLQLSIAPSGWYFNFADSGDRRLDQGNLTLAWFAAKTGDARYLERDRFLVDPATMGELSRAAGAGLVWLAQFEERESSILPGAWKGEGDNPIAIFRDGYSDSNGYYFGGKGGRGTVNHGNLDAGSFVFELDGVRWSIDPGNQSYHPLEREGFDLWGSCQQCERWRLLTKNNFGHSTLTANDDLHRADGYAPLVDFDDGPRPRVTYDLTEVFGNQLTSARRTFTRDGDRSLLIEDELALSDSTREITWQLMTTAEVVSTASGAELRQDGKVLSLEILSPPEASISVVSLDPPPHPLDRRIEHLKRVEIRLPADAFPGGEGEISVRLSGPPR